MKATKIRQRELLIDQVVELSKEGLTTREIGELVGRSHAWVATALIERKELSTGISSNT